MSPTPANMGLRWGTRKPPAGAGEPAVYKDPDWAKQCEGGFSMWVLGVVGCVGALPVVKQDGVQRGILNVKSWLSYLLPQVCCLIPPLVTTWIVLAALLLQRPFILLQKPPKIWKLLSPANCVTGTSLPERLQLEGWVLYQAWCSICQLPVTASLSWTRGCCKG